ncbi:MAG: archaellin/type IV pilin N-terminal domain-containing protein [archaeon]
MVKNKKGVSPVIATVLLIAIVIVIATIIFLWARGFIKESIMKQDKPDYQACREINLETAINNDKLEIVNRGNIPVYIIDINMREGGTVYRQTEKIELGQGEAKVISDSEGPHGDFSAYSEVELVPAILGLRGSTKTIKYCTEDTILA